MKLSSFKFDLPSELIAQKPNNKRDESRLLVVHRGTGKMEDKVFRDLPEYFSEEDLLVVNNTKVFPARLYGIKEKTGAKIEVFLLRELNAKNKLWDVIVDPARKIRVGNKLFFGDQSLVAEVIDNTTSRGRTIRFHFDGTDEEFRTKLHELGNTPLPPYIKREATPEDTERYQTIYAKNEGAVAAPTAGMHFSVDLIKKLEIEGVRFAEVTLHTGLGTFRPIEVEDLSKHKIDVEYYNIDQNTADLVNYTKKIGKNVCAVGTTSVRALESSVTASGNLKPSEGWTNKYITPPYDFQIPTSMITNFHLPKTSLIVMVAAFTGYELLMEAYQHAMKEKYQFFSYGDAMLIL